LSHFERAKSAEAAFQAMTNMSLFATLGQQPQNMHVDKLISNWGYTLNLPFQPEMNPDSYDVDLQIQNYLVQKLRWDSNPFIRLVIQTQTLKLEGLKKNLGYGVSRRRYNYYKLENLHNKYAKMKLLVCGIRTLIDRETKFAIESKELSYISASDIASYSFCPASYSIKKSFNLNATENMDIGEELHNSHRLLNRYQFTQGRATKTKITSMAFAKNSEFYSDLFSSKLIFTGHPTDDITKYFTNGKYIGQPDYIFQNSKHEFFIIEEKFTFSFANFRSYINHELQTYSYIYGIKEYPCEYGYLIYWLYGYNDEGELTVVNCEIKKLSRAEAMRKKLRQVCDAITTLNVQNEIAFNPQFLNAKKCANCSVSGSCEHKYADQEKLKFPYTTNFQFSEVTVKPTDSIYWKLWKYSSRMEKLFEK
jgi:CRISPR/Cas system-associated exonuclease Cas4 (RecB family)